MRRDSDVSDRPEPSPILRVGEEVADFLPNLVHRDGPAYTGEQSSVGGEVARIESAEKRDKRQRVRRQRLPKDLPPELRRVAEVLFAVYLFERLHAGGKSEPPPFLPRARLRYISTSARDLRLACSIALQTNRSTNGYLAEADPKVWACLRGTFWKRRILRNRLPTTCVSDRVTQVLDLRFVPNSVVLETRRSAVSGRVEEMVRLRTTGYTP